MLVCGGRDYANYEALERVLGSMHRLEPIDHLIHGGATGADYLADRWADKNHVPRTIILAEWKKYGRAAGPRRNQRLLDEGRPDLVVAFPGGKGTADMVRRARAAGVNVVEIHGEEAWIL